METQTQTPAEGARTAESEEFEAAKTSRWVRLRRFTREVFSFLSVGGIAYIVDVGLSNLLLFGLAGVPALLDGSPVKAKVVSTVVSVAVAWLGNRFLTYGSRNPGSEFSTIWKFAVVNAIGMVIVVAPLGVTWYLLEMRDPISYNISTNIVGIGLAMVFRFWAYRTWVFPDRVADREVISQS